MAEKSSWLAVVAVLQVLPARAKKWAVKRRFWSGLLLTIAVFQPHYKSLGPDLEWKMQGKQVSKGMHSSSQVLLGLERRTGAGVFGSALSSSLFGAT